MSMTHAMTHEVDTEDAAVSSTTMFMCLRCARRELGGRFTIEASDMPLPLRGVQLLDGTSARR